MSQQGKILFIVLDGIGVGASPDARFYGDEGTNTLCNTAKATGGLRLPNLAQLGLGNIADILGVPMTGNPLGCYGTMREASKGKDSTTGHWELAGIIVQKDFPYYPKGFPQSLIDRFLSETKLKGVLGNKAASGTQIIDELGDEHVRTGFPIVYTSADSVFQIAAHEGVISLSQLYEICSITRTNVMVNEDAVGRVIARPFIGSSGHYTRTVNRKDFSLIPPSVTVLDILFSYGIPTIAIGKIDDLFAGKGLKEKIHTHSNAEGIDGIIGAARTLKSGMIMANLVDFDMQYGHRQDPAGMKDALEYFDRQLPRILDSMEKDDLLLLTADHGNDPTDSSTDHSREDVPVLAYSKSGKRGVHLGLRTSFADAGKTVAEYFGVPAGEIAGQSFLRLMQ